jgi:alkylation response protein AidB-like acyl-CoA dehydrogenase
LPPSRAASGDPDDRSGDYDAFLASFRSRLQRALHVRADIDRLALDRGLPPHVIREIRADDPFAAFIPEEYGGRGGDIAEGLGLLSAASYESLALSAIFALNWSLFLQPVAKYGDDRIKAPVFDRFLHDDCMGGFMLTEPEFGSDALHIQTSYVEDGGHYRVQGTKHWGGLTGSADFWLVAARERRDEGLCRDIDFFICDQDSPDQHIEVEEFFENLGLYMIPYGRNDVDVRVPGSQRLQPERTGISMMMDILHRSRMQFPGMGMGFLHRLLDETLEHCKQRSVGGGPLFSYDQVQQRLARIQAAFTVASAMCVHCCDEAQLESACTRKDLEANAIKAVLSDLMQEASQSALQLFGAEGYRLDHIAGRATVDSRPFQIFEGSNDILYQQITESIVGQMDRESEPDLLELLSSLELTARAADRCRDALSFRLERGMSQRKQVQLGRALGRVISLQLVLELGDRGFREDLIRGAVRVLQQDVSSLLGGFRQVNEEDAVDDYGRESSWLEFVDT